VTVRMGRSAARRRAAVLVPALALAVGAAGSITPAAAAVDVPTTNVVVRELHPASSTAEQAVAALGGMVTQDLSLVGSFVAEVPSSAVDALSSAAGVADVTPAAPIHFDGAYGQGSGGPSAVYSSAVRADKVWAAGHTGEGVGVAVIDTGVNAVGDLAGRVSHSMDFTKDQDNVDHFGHGTFVAGMVAGTGSTGTGVKGTAPGAHIISLKIAGRNGAADITHVMAAIQYAVSFKDHLDIDVINLSLGTDSKQDYRVDLLNMAVERAWANGITVIVSASNLGPDSGTITKPADDPFVITVGAASDRSTPGIGDDTVPAFSAAGPTKSNNVSKPDLVAPGGSVVSTRAPGSTVDVKNPSARVGEHHFVGSGTSFASGVVAGAAALVLSSNPSLTPDQIKARLVDTARPGPVTDRQRVGAGWLDAEAAVSSTSLREANQGLSWSDGSGSLQASRGSTSIKIETGTILDPLLGPLPILTLVTGDLTAQNRLFDYEAFRKGEWSASSWYASSWYASSWYASSWYASSWYASSWYASSWYASSWYASSWYAGSWS
jgi:serine protease AprX